MWFCYLLVCNIFFFWLNYVECFILIDKIVKVKEFGYDIILDNLDNYLKRIKLNFYIIKIGVKFLNNYIKVIYFGKKLFVY